MHPLPNSDINYCLRDMPLCSVAVFWTFDSRIPRVCRILLSTMEVPITQTVRDFMSGSASRSCAQVDTLMEQIEAFLNGADIQFSLTQIQLEKCATFQQKVLRAEHAILRGRVSTYSLMARHLKVFYGARAVGNALANNPFPIVIPCHRVIRSDGSLGGYQGGLKMKKALLEMEGIAFQDDTHVETRNFYYLET